MKYSTAHILSTFSEHETKLQRIYDEHIAVILFSFDIQWPHSEECAGYLFQLPSGFVMYKCMTKPAGN